MGFLDSFSQPFQHNTENQGSSLQSYQPLAADQSTSRTACVADASGFTMQDRQHARPAGNIVDLGWQFIQRLGRLCCIINVTPAIVLVLLSVWEAIIISYVGTISSRFYQVFVDGQQSAVAHLMAWSAGCYGATALFLTVKESLRDLFAWRWRAALTCHLQDAYCSNLAFYNLKVGPVACACWSNAIMQAVLGFSPWVQALQGRVSGTLL